MTKLTPPISATGDAKVYAGEPLVIELEVQDASGQTVNLAGRSFSLAVFRRIDRAVLASDATIATGEVPVLALSGDDTEALFAQGRSTALGIEVAETLDDGVDLKLAGNLVVALRAASAGSAQPSRQFAGPVTRLVFNERINRVVISQRGAPGLSAFQQLALAGVLAEPTVEAFTAWIGGIVAEQMAPILDLGDPNNSAGRISQL